MNFTSADIKFILSYLGAIAVLWRASSWVTRKQIIVETFLGDIRDFMQTATQTLHRIETNHLVHIQNALTGRDEYVQIVAQEDPTQEDNDAIRES
jgi:hypothetical protein